MAKANFKPAAAQPTKARKVADQQALMSRAIAGVSGAVLDSSKEEQVDVVVPKAFRLTDDGHIVYPYSTGPQKMPKSHASHPYSIANGVKLA